MEFIFELILEVGDEYAKSEKAPLILRRLIVSSMVILIIVFLWSAFKLRNEGTLMMLPLFLACVVGGLLYQFLQALKKRVALRKEAMNE